MKPIKLTEDARQAALTNFQQMLANYTGDSDLTIKITTESLLNYDTIVKPKVYVTTDAYMQMMLLIQQCSKEIAWHGVVTKTEHDYLITKVLTYPQIVTGTTVDADEEAYAKWLMHLNNDTINNLRF